MFLDQLTQLQAVKVQSAAAPCVRSHIVLRPKIAESFCASTLVPAQKVRTIPACGKSLALH
jgi:hypothetical protein